MEGGAEARESGVRHSLHRHVSLDGTELMRGVGLPHIMRNFGSLLESSGGAAGAYELSTTATVIEEFLSHNWSTGRQDKFLALSVHYHTLPAVLTAWSVGVVSMALTIAGHLPWFDFGPTKATCINAWLSGHLAFGLVFLFAQDIRRLLARLISMKPHLVFLDKACIDQSNACRQRRGIENLAGFLQMSKTMVVIYTPDYLRRLWTVYELASFMLLHQDSRRISILPILWVKHFTCLILGFFGLAALHWVLYFLSEHTGVLQGLPGLLYIVMGLVITFLWSIAARHWQRQLASMEDAIQNFSIRSATCAVEEDRKLVEGNICSFMRCLGWVLLQDREAALSLFDEAVREALPICLAASVRGKGFPYLMCVSASMTFMLIALDHIAAEVRADSGLARTAAKAGHSVLMCFGIIPLAVGLCNWVVSHRLHLRGRGEICLCVLALLPGQLMTALSFILMSVANHSEGLRATLALGAMLVYGAGVAACTFLFYRRAAKRARPLSWSSKSEPEELPKALPGLPASCWSAREICSDDCQVVVTELSLESSGAGSLAGG